MKKIKNSLCNFLTTLIILMPCMAAAQLVKDSAAGVSAMFMPFRTLIPDSAICNNGLFRIYQVRNNYYLELSDSMYHKPFLLVNRISKGAADGQSEYLGYGGDLLGKIEVQFTPGPDNKIFLQKLHTFDQVRDSSGNGMWRALDKSTFLPLLVAFDVKSISPSGAKLIDITSFLLSDNEITGFGTMNKGRIGIKAFFPDRSFIQKVNAYPHNVEIKTVRSYVRQAEIPVSYEFNLSIVMLPDKLMRSRLADRRVGYFSVMHRDFDANPQRVLTATKITRWRIEPKPEDVNRYLSGELVEPQKPIIFYIDPATPQKWVPWLIKGVNDWQQAFEKAGFKNAIYALEAPVADSTWSIEDARHNAIVYKPSEMMNASGPHVSDPRSGEILESHINWYHNILALLQEWYFIQAAAVDPQARQLPMNDTLMGKLVRFVCSHEVGHTLGLRHNFGASYAYPVDSLRNLQWVKKHGHTPSIMDYARFNYVAQPGDGITQDYLIPRIGIYDEWAIEYGYRWFPPISETEEDTKIKKWLGEKVSADNRLWFGSEESSLDSRCLSEDLGDNAAKAGSYGIRNLKYIMKNLIEWTAGDERLDNYEELRRMEEGVWKQYNRYLNHAVEQIGGGMFTSKTRMQKGRVVDFVSKEKQKEILAFLNRESFITPQWLITPGIFALAGGKLAMFRIGESQSAVLNKLLSEGTFSLLSFSVENMPEKAYKPSEFLSDLKNYVFVELKNHTSIGQGRRGLQKRYLERLEVLLTSGKEQNPLTYYSDFLTLIKAQARDLENSIRLSKSRFTDIESLNHLEDLQDRLKKMQEIKLTAAK